MSPEDGAVVKAVEDGVVVRRGKAEEDGVVVSKTWKKPSKRVERRERTGKREDGEEEKEEVEEGVISSSNSNSKSSRNRISQLHTEKSRNPTR